MHPHLAGNKTVYYMTIFKLNLEGGIRQVFNNLALHFNVIFLRHTYLLQRRRAFEICLFQQALILVRHDISLHLRHEVHGDDHDNQ